MIKKPDLAAVHPRIPEAVDALSDGRLGRRDFLRTVTLLGLSAGTAYGLAGAVTGDTALAQTETQAGAPVSGGTLRIGMAVMEVTDPAIVDWSEKGNALRMALEPLVRIGHDDVAHPFLAERWEANADLTQWTIHLRRDVTWSNGDAFVAADVVANFERWLDPAVGSSNLGRFSALTVSEGDRTVMAPNAIEVLDDHTVRFTLQQPNLQFPESLGDYTALIAHRSLGETLANGGSWMTDPIGTGPFALQRIRVGEVAEFTRRDPATYWGPEVHLDGVRFVDLGGDPAAHIAALASDQVDLLHHLDISVVPQAAAVPGVEIYEKVTASAGVARMRVTEAPFDNKTLRKAIQRALDRDRILALAYSGQGATGQDHPVSPIHPEYTPLPLPPRDVEASRALLAEAGYPDGIEITMQVVNDPAWESRIALAMKEQLAEADITLNVEIMPGGTYWDRWTTWPFSITQWATRPLGVQVMALAYRSGVPWNETGYSNPEFDALLDRAEATLDVDERSAQVAEMCRMIQDDAIAVVPFWREIFTAGRARVQNYQYHVSRQIYLDGVWLA